MSNDHIIPIQSQKRMPISASDSRQNELERSFGSALVPAFPIISPGMQATPDPIAPADYSLKDIPVFPVEQPNRTGLPGALKSGIERLSGLSLDDVRVHYHSPKPAQVQALAYTQGAEIYIGMGQERYLPHEAWHVIQQKQGRVETTMDVRGINLNNDNELEQEATTMGAKALQMGYEHPEVPEGLIEVSPSPSRPLQRMRYNGRDLSDDQLQAIAELLEKKSPKLVAILRQALDQEALNVVNDLAGYFDDKDRQDINKLLEYTQTTQSLSPQTLINNNNNNNGQIKTKTWKKKIGYTLEKDDKGNPKYAEDAIRLIQAFKEMRVARKQQKETFYTQSLENLKSLNLKQKQEILFGEYPKLLHNFDNERALLQDTQNWKDSKFRIRESGFEIHNEQGEVFARLEEGVSTFTSDDEKGTERKIYTALGGKQNEYVQDDRGAYTRRYAYVEKNYYQFMELLSVGCMTGRFQMFHEATGEKANLLYPGSGAAAKIVVQDLSKPLDASQLAVLHQRMGNGTQQRGLSLTSAPKEGVIYGNEGESFREDYGVRLKIDLAKVPMNVVLLNHYGPSGIVENLETVSEQSKTRSGGYDYPGSVQKNRELYLQELRIEWIVAATFHDKEGSLDSDRDLKASEDPSTEKWLWQKYKQYIAGFEEGVEAKGVVSSSKDDKYFENGFESGKLYSQGYKDGKDKRGKNIGKRIDSGKKQNNLHISFTILAEEFISSEATRKREGRKRYPDIYWIGFGHGMSGSERKKTIDEYFYKKEEQNKNKND